jgi:hypothetical protein
VDSAADPFWPTDGSTPNLCPPDAYLAEDSGDGMWFSLETSNCNYMTVSQPLLADVTEDAVIQVRVWHFKITGSVGKFYHRIAAGDPPQILWEVEKAVPTESGGLLPFEPVSPKIAVSAGEAVYWHVSNHGQNSWHLIELSATY